MAMAIPKEHVVPHRYLEKWMEVTLVEDEEVIANEVVGEEMDSGAAAGNHHVPFIRLGSARTATNADSRTSCRMKMHPSPPSRPAGDIVVLLAAWQMVGGQQSLALLRTRWPIFQSRRYVHLSCIQLFSNRNCFASPMMQAKVLRRDHALQE